VILSITTLKDSAANVEKWVRRNLAGGIDHMIVFLDAPQPEVEALLADRPQVTAVRAYDEWFSQDGPLSLNDRQIINAGLTSRLLVGMPWADWLFHLDGDEVAQIDREALDAISPDVRVVRLQVLEAVSRMHPDRDPTLFKRRLTEPELSLVTALGVIGEPNNLVYFRGHSWGKPGLRPTRDLAIGVHHVLDPQGERLEQVGDERLRLLHYESHSGDEFVRKWTALLRSGGEPVFQRAHRAPMRDAIGALLSLDLGAEETERFLTTLYERWAVDDVDTLSGLGLLVEVDPDAHARAVPAPPPGSVEQLRTLLDEMHPVPKLQFRTIARESRVEDTTPELQQSV
jgi:Glycosyl transferase family 2